MDYSEYLKSEEWKIKRGIARDMAEQRCQLCNSTGQLDVHHRTYNRIHTNEEYKDLVVLCRNCHNRFHNKLAETNKDFISVIGIMSMSKDGEISLSGTFKTIDEPSVYDDDESPF